LRRALAGSAQGSVTHWGVLVTDPSDGLRYSLEAYMTGTFIELIPVQNVNEYTVVSYFCPNDTSYSWHIQKVGETWRTDEDLRLTGRIFLSLKQCLICSRQLCKSIPYV